MTALSLGDLAQSYSNRLANVRLRTQLSDLSAQMATGRRDDTAIVASGDVAPLGALERSLTVTDAYRSSAAEATTLFAGAERALAVVADATGLLGSRLAATRIGGDDAGIDALAAEARGQFASAVAGLNATVAGRSVFAGTGTDGPALTGAETMLADIAAALGAPASAAELLSGVQDWFAPGGGFDSQSYLGTAERMTGLQVAPGERLTLPATAAEPEPRAALAALAAAALLDTGMLDAQPEERRLAAAAAGEWALQATDGVTEMRARIGAEAARAEAAAGRAAAERAGLEMARADLVGIDPYETATRLEQTRSNLETLYAVTARLQSLSLVNYL